MTGAGRGAVAFDNTGTLSAVEAEVIPVADDPRFQRRVPDIDPAVRAALVSVDGVHQGAFRSDDTISAVVERADLPVHVALSNTDTDDDEARRAVLADGRVPARRVADGVDDLVRRVAGDFEGPPPVGVQLVVDLDGGTIHRVIAYTTVPHPRAAGIVERVRANGFDPHIVSGDATHILEAVAEVVGVPAGNVHAYQSADGKADVVRRLRETYDGPVVVVGDYVNDRLAFRVADRSLLVSHDGEPEPSLRDVADVVVDEFDDVPDLI